MNTCRAIRGLVSNALGSLLLAACSTANNADGVVDASVIRDTGKPDDAAAAVSPPDRARALATFEPTVAAEGGADMPVALWGRADLWEHGPDVTLRFEVRGCRPGAIYRARIHTASDCSERALAAGAGSGGETLDDFGCAVAGGSIIGYYARRAGDDRPWSIGGSRDTDVVGRALTLSEAAVATDRPVTCAVIERAPDADSSETTDTQGPTLPIRAAVAGVCAFDRLVPTVEPNCPEYAAAVRCATTRCELNRCIDHCASYVKCLAQARGVDVCMAAYTCEPSEACSSCQSEVVRCELAVCLDTLACGEPASPDGACSQLLRCCNANSENPATCLDYTKLARLSGDAECQRIMDSWNVGGDHSQACPFQ